MKTVANNPWAARFEPLLDKNTLKQRAQVSVPSLIGLRDMPTELACARLENALESVFYPTTQCLDILGRLVATAYAHCMMQYKDPKAFIAGVYAKDSPLPEFSYPLLLTGLAGTGKTQIVKAFRRILPEESKISVDGEHSPFPLKGPWFIKVQVHSSPNDIFRALAQTDSKLPDLVERCRRIAFRDGIPYLIPDEFQFATGSSTANALVTQMLLSLGYVGIPCTFIANFSLVKRLLNRPEEDRQRLLSDWIILHPDPPNSKDWVETLKAQKGVAPKILTFDPANDAAALHTYSAGRKRAMAKLLVLACRNEHPQHGSIDLAAIKRAFHSPGYSSYREESEILATQAIQNKPDKDRKDLWCPLSLPPDATAAFTKTAHENRNQKVADSELISSLNFKERQALKGIKKEMNITKKSHGEVLSLRKRSSLTADDLKKNANLFKDQI